MATLLGRVLSPRRRFSTQTLKLSPTSCLFFLLQPFWNGLTKVVFVFFFYFCFRCVWPISDLLAWYYAYFQALEISSNDGLKWEHVESCSSSSKTLYLYNHNVYGHQTWQGGNLPYLEGLPLIKSLDPLITGPCKIIWQTINISPLPEYLWPPNLVGWWLTLRGSDA